MKLSVFSLLWVFPILVNCSSIPEIKAYKPMDMASAEYMERQNSSYDPVFDEPMTASNYEFLPEQNEETEAVDISKPVMVKEAVIQPVKRPSRDIASHLQNGFYTFSKNCPMMEKPDTESPKVGDVQSGKKLWLDKHDAQWMKAYKKSGPVYVPAECLI